MKPCTIHHGRCHGCTRQLEYGSEYCENCKYFHSPVSPHPDLYSDKPVSAIFDEEMYKNMPLVKEAWDELEQAKKKYILALKISKIERN